MATSKSKDGGANIRYDEFIKHIRPDASKADPVVVLHGYVGESGSDDKIRLYADDSLTEFADILKTDILYAVPDQDNPLGGSRLWIKQSAEVNHTDANAYAQGDMYNSYMGNMYDGGAANMGAGAIGATGPAAFAILTQNAMCRPSRFICPGPPPTQPILCNRLTRIIRCQVHTIGGGCTSWDGCPSQLCTIDMPGRTTVCATDITRTIRVNPGGGFADAYGTDYAGGDMYNDYMSNAYDGGGTGAFGGTTLTADCLLRVKPISQVYCLTPSRFSICRSVQIPCVSKQIRCYEQCQYGSLDIPIRSLPCQTDFTRTIRTVTVNPGGGGFADAYGGDYAGGDMYNDYMGNTYDGGDTMNMAGAAATAACTVPVTFNCPASRTICPTPQSRLIICNQVTRQAYCLLTRNIQCQVTRGGCPQPSWVDACPSALGCTIQQSIACATDITRTIRTVGVNPGGFADAYGSDYAGGDMYNDYMQNSYDGGAENMGGAGAAGATLTAGCFQVATRTPNCFKQSLLVICPRSTPLICFRTFDIRCQITCFNRTIGPPINTRNCPSAVDGCPSGFCPDTLLTREIRGGGIQGGGFADAYGADYSGGDLYNDYMANDYSGEADMAGAGAQATLPTRIPVQCGITLRINCPTRPANCPSVVRNCPTLQPTRYVLCCNQPTRNPAATRCCTRPPFCPVW